SAGAVTKSLALSRHAPGLTLAAHRPPRRRPSAARRVPRPPFRGLGHASQIPSHGPAMTRHILAIDLGTSALKVALVSTAGEVAAAEQDTCQVRLLPGGGAEQDPEQWWDLITAAASRLMARAGVPAESGGAVACTAQWSGTVPVDERCQPLRDAIIWMDSRGAPYVERITRGAVNVQGYGVGKLARWLRTTAGIPARSGKDPIAHILWLKHEE